VTKTFVTDPRVIAYRRAFQANAKGDELVAAERGLAEYMLDGAAPALKMVTMRVLAREGFSRQALIEAGSLTPLEEAGLPPADNPDDPHAGLRAMPYAEYLQTDHWRFVRELALSRANGLCGICRRRDQLDVHHTTYERRGEELAGDLIVLCRGCHRTFHENGRLAAA
jgi:hypothetical protein